MKMDLLSRIQNYRNVISWVRRYPKTSRSKFSIFRDYCSLYRHKGLLTSEYENFEFEKRSEDFRASFLGINERRIYLDLLNPIVYHTCSRNKYITHKMFEQTGIKTSVLYCHYQPEGRYGHDVGYTAHDLETVSLILKDQDVQTCVIKPTESSHGDGVYVIRQIEYQENDAVLEQFDGSMVMLSDILADRALIFESVVHQTKQFDSFNQSSVNTIRFMTTLYPDGTVNLYATFIKIGRAGKCIDNAGGGGNVDVCVDVETGEIKYAIQYDGWRNIKDIDKHPDSGNQLNGVVIDNWDAIKTEVVKFQQAFPYCKAAGWDIAVTDEGPLVIEVNDAWDTTGQYFCRKGWRKEVRDCYLAWERTGKSYSNRVVNSLSSSQKMKIIK